MGRQFQYTSFERILSKIYRDVGLEEISETDVIEWTGEALEFMETPSILEEAVAFIEVRDHHIDLPNGFKYVIQLARNNDWSKEAPCPCPADVLLDDDCTTESNCASTCHTGPEGTECYPVPLDCMGTPITDYDVAYYRPYFDLQYEYYGWSGSRLFQRKYTPVRLANHSFFNSVVCSQDGQDIYPQGDCNNYNMEDEYTVVQDRLRLSFREGSVALSYYRTQVGEDGYPLVPDDASFTSAITWYITWKYMARMWMMGREGFGDKMQYAESQWQWYAKQASNKAFTLHGIDEHQNLLETLHHWIPRKNRYYNYFGKLGRQEYTGFKDPNRRNFRLRGI